MNTIGLFIISSFTALVIFLGFILYDMIKTKNTYGRRIPLPPEHLRKAAQRKSILYKPIQDQTLEVEIKQKDGKIEIDFYSDSGKFGTHEPIAGWVLTPERLKQILKEREDITDNEL